MFLPGSAEPGGDEAAGGFDDGRGVALGVGRLGEDEALADQAGKAGRRDLFRFARFQFFGGVSDTVLVFDEVDSAVFGADDEVGFPVLIEVTNRGAAGVAGDVAPSRGCRSF